MKVVIKITPILFYGSKNFRSWEICNLRNKKQELRKY